MPNAGVKRRAAFSHVRLDEMLDRRCLNARKCGTTKLKGVGDVGDWCICAAGAGNHNAPKVEDASDDALVDVKAFDFVVPQLNSVATNEAKFGDDAF